ncbi:hypothetical protein MRB53_004582 [Persea americana]|uniref:Uncharacterized protein n=1 Tax=Persea americana TaxID=3435 RepID=A0ACC2MAV1_PERAE|nr:hypothetical protein MRB53_004582 [Persea americana]
MSFDESIADCVWGSQISHHTVRTHEGGWWWLCCKSATGVGSASSHPPPLSSSSWGGDGDGGSSISGHKRGREEEAGQVPHESLLREDLVSGCCEHEGRARKWVLLMETDAWSYRMDGLNVGLHEDAFTQKAYWQRRLRSR